MRTVRPRYDDVYLKPERAADIAFRPWLAHHFGAVRCWRWFAAHRFGTPHVASGRATLIATDGTAEPAGLWRKSAGLRACRIRAVDATTSCQKAWGADAAFAGLWFSRMCQSAPGLVPGWAPRALHPGSRVVLMDNNESCCWISPSSRPTGEGTPSSTAARWFGPSRAEDFPDESRLRELLQGTRPRPSRTGCWTSSGC